MDNDLSNIIDYYCRNTNNDPSSLTICHVAKSEGAHGRQFFNIDLQIRGDEHSLFVKLFSKPDRSKAHNDIGFAKSEVYALRKLSRINAPTPQIILKDFSGEILDRPFIVTSKIRGSSLDRLFNAAEGKAKKRCRV